MSSQLEHIISASAAKPVPGEIAAMAQLLRKDFPGGAVAAILAYGSCLRGVSVSESLVDFYVLVHRAGQTSTSVLSRTACRLLPPNVYYREFDIDGKKLRCKYAVTDIATFGRWMQARTANPYFWARFAQPSAIVCASDEAARGKVIAHIASAVATMLAHCPVDEKDTARKWQAGFEQTYRTELRSERTGRAARIVEQNIDYYEAVTAVVRPPAIKVNWLLVRLQGKVLSILRLAKAAFTFAGAADYIAWKISRHSGVEVKLRPWQRRHPVLAAIVLLPGLLKKGAVR